MIDFNKFMVLSFDCYGTLIDWEKGILEALKPFLISHNIMLNDEEILEIYADIEAYLEKGKFIRYREILQRVVKEIANRFDFIPSVSEMNCLVDSLKNWRPFPDTVEALRFFKKSFKLAIISNIDNDLFNMSAKRLKVEFDWIITAEHVGSYKPCLANFEVAIEIIGVTPEKILHIAQSIYHDIIPAKTLGLSTVWVNRRKNKKGSGATPSAIGYPDLEVPDLKTLTFLFS